ncbi:MAG: SDR family NAD(P)-dependent oxidoreductase, partial [Planctomycetes bacterium]|nr:SDR family NAD(P)-dependent oxidoreductase [Planctomycetota bacterium]
MAEPRYIITGASSGIGAALALRLAKDGSSLGLIARRPERLEDVAQACREHGVTVATRLADVPNHDGLKAAILELDDALEGADVLISNAGVAIPTPAIGGEIEDIKTVIDVNLTGALAAIHAILPRFLERKAGQVVGVASVAGYRGLPGSGSYSASKAGFIAALESMRVEL